MSKYTKEDKLDLLVYKLQHPEDSYTDLAFRFKVAKSTITSWGNDPVLVAEAMKMIGSSSAPEVDILAMRKNQLSRKEAINNMLFDTVNRIYTRFDEMKHGDKIRFSAVLKDISRDDIFKEQHSGKTKSVVQELVDKYKIDLENKRMPRAEA